MPFIELTEKQVRDAVRQFVDEVKDDYRRDHYDRKTSRETLIERIDEDQDQRIWGDLVMNGRIDQYDVDDMTQTAAACAAIIKVAEADAWVEDDTGLWHGLTYGVMASIAYYSLRNLLYNALKNAGIDTNEEYPFKHSRLKKRK